MPLWDSTTTTCAPLARASFTTILHIVVLDAEAPVRNHVARVGDRRVGECLADDRDRNAVDLLDDVGLEHRVAEIVGLDVLRDEIHLALEVVVHDLLDPLCAQREFPVAGHDIDAQQLAGIDHVLALGPQCSGGALPGIAAIEQQGAGTAGADFLDQCGQMGEAADLAVGAGGIFKIEVGECMGLARAGPDAEMP